MIIKNEVDSMRVRQSIINDIVELYKDIREHLEGEWSIDVVASTEAPVLVYLFIPSYKSDKFISYLKVLEEKYNKEKCIGSLPIVSSEFIVTVKY